MSDLERIGEDLAGVLRKLGLPGPDTAERVVEEWSDLAGEPWASRARPGAIRDGVLWVEAVDPAAAALLRYRVTALIERLNDALGPGAVTAVKIRVADRKNRG
jgi:predicted nucleic acid-binding Zn ribbon protein